MPEDIEVTDILRVRGILDDLMEEYVRNGFSTPYNTSET